MAAVPVLEEVLVDVYPGVPPVHVEVQRVGDGEVPVVDHEHVADMDLNLDQVGLNNISVIFRYPCFGIYYGTLWCSKSQFLGSRVGLFLS